MSFISYYVVFSDAEMYSLTISLNAFCIDWNNRFVKSIPQLFSW